MFYSCRYKIKIFCSCRTRVVSAALVSHLCNTRFGLVSLVLHSCCIRVAHVWHSCCKLYYVSIISDRFLVRSVKIHHVLQCNGNRNVVGSIRHVFCFHLERYDKIIKIAYTSYILTFPSNQ